MLEGGYVVWVIHQKVSFTSETRFMLLSIWYPSSWLSQFLLQPYQMLLSLPQPEKTTVCTCRILLYLHNFLCSVPSPRSLLPTTPLLCTDNLSQILSASRSLPCLGVGLHSVQLLIFLSAPIAWPVPVCILCRLHTCERWERYLSKFNPRI